MYDNHKERFQNIIEQIKEDGLYKHERVIVTKQGALVNTTTGKNLINLCSNNYLGLASNKEVMDAAIKAVETHGFGMSSVRFICGTQDTHKQLENDISKFLGTEDTILYGSCFDANGGLFETITGNEDAIISDELNHASIIDGVRLSKAVRYRYKNNDMADLEEKLIGADKNNAKLKVIVTDGVFSMDGIITNLKGVCSLAEKYNALVVVDDSHATGVIGKTGRGTPEHCGVMDKVDIITSTLGKACGGASGGFTSGKKEIIELLRQRSRPYLFSNTLSPIIASGSLKVLELVTESGELKKRLEENTAYFRNGIKEIGFDIIEGTHPIVPIMLYDELPAQQLAEKLLEKGVYAVGFFYPVVPKGRARIRTQASAGHTKEQLEYVVNAFVECKKELGL